MDGKKIKNCGKYFIVLVSILLLIFFVETAFAVKGIVVYKKIGCDYFIVKTNNGYALLEWYGGNDPNEGDIIIGNFESYGFKDICNLSTDLKARVWVEEYWILLWEDALELYFEHCD